MSILDLRFVALVLAAVAVVHGTYYSHTHSTYLDTSDPFLTAQAHPLASTHPFASKRSPLNLIFLKWSWAWSTAAFLSLFVPTTTSPHPRNILRRLLQWIFATAAWFACAVSFFGPSLLARLATVSGAECGLHLGPATFVPIPTSFCAAGLPVTRAANPELFPLVLLFETEPDRPFVPRLRRGHDVSGHVFLLTLAVLFLADQLRQTRSVAHVYARAAVGALLALWVFSLWVTGVYFHSPSEKISGFCMSSLSISSSSPHLTFLCSYRSRVLYLFANPIVVLINFSLSLYITFFFLTKKKISICKSVNSVYKTSIQPQQPNPYDDRGPYHPSKIPPSRAPHLLPPSPAPRHAPSWPPLGRLHRDSPPPPAERKGISE